MVLIHKEMTAHIRKCIKRAGIKARVSMNVCCGTKNICVNVPTYESRFSADEIRRIAEIAVNNELTSTRRIEIDPAHESLLTGKIQWSFEYHPCIS